MIFSIIPYTAEELFSNSAIQLSLDTVHSVSKQFYQICILKKNDVFSDSISDMSSCLFLFYELSDTSSLSKKQTIPSLPDGISYVDVGNSCLCHILAMLASSCPDLYPILETQYQLFLTQQFLEALQNGYHSRMRDLIQSLTDGLEKKY